jgi:YggT family protein
MDFAPFVVLILIAILNYAIIPNLAAALISPGM